MFVYLYYEYLEWTFEWLNLKNYRFNKDVTFTAMLLFRNEHNFTSKCKS